MSEADYRAIGSAVVGEYGAATPTLTLAEVTIAAAWNVQGNPAQSALVNLAWQLFGLALPLEANTTAHNDALTALWLGPKSWLLVAGVHDALTDPTGKRDALNNVGGALFEVSASRVGWSVSGANAARILQKTCPLDLDSRTFAAGGCAQSMLGHINALFYKYDEAPTFIVMVARSLAADAWRLLCESAALEGYRVALPVVFQHT